MDAPQSTTVVDANLWQEIESLGQRVDALERCLGKDAPVQEHPTVGEIESALAIAKQHFPGDVEFQLQLDPECPGYEYPVVMVNAHGDVKEIEYRQIRWHEEVRRTLGT